METKSLKELIERHRGFWAREETDKPLVMAERGWTGLSERVVEVPLLAGGLAPEDSKLDPTQLDAGAYVRDYAKVDSPFDGEIIQTLRPPDLCWTEAIVGCDVHLAAGSRWTTPYMDEVKPTPARKYGRQNPWFGKLFEFVRALVEESAGRLPVGEPLMRGPIDMLRAMVGDSALCLALYEKPQELHRLHRLCTDIFLDCHKAQFELIPQFHGGHVCHYGIWAPGTVGYCQLDASALLSPATFREHFLADYARVADSFDYTMFHVHSGCLRHTEALLELDGLNAVQVSIDPVPFGPTVDEMIPIFQRIQEVKPLIIASGPVTREESERIRAALSPRGLCLGIAVYGEGQDLYTV